VTSQVFRDRLLAQLHVSSVEVPQHTTLDKLYAYYDLLMRWNAKINLTGLSLEDPTDETLDRIFTEPLAAARYFPSSSSGGKRWFDFGSGGGSPAIPLKLALGDVRLTMVESRERKAAFLREVVRILEISATDVANVRFEGLVDANATSAQAVTVRAVRIDEALSETARKLLDSAGKLLLFQTTPSEAPLGFILSRGIPLLSTNTSYLSIYSPAQSVPRGTNG